MKEIIAQFLFIIIHIEYTDGLVPTSANLFGTILYGQWSIDMLYS